MQVKAYSPAWAELVTGVNRAEIIKIAREFGENAEKTHGRSMIIVGAGLNHWYPHGYVLTVASSTCWYFVAVLVKVVAVGRTMLVKKNYVLKLAGNPLLLA